MSRQQPRTIEVHFTLSGGESSDLIVSTNERGVAFATAILDSMNAQYFPRREHVERSGSLSSDTLRACERNILEICGDGWRHRYGEASWDTATQRDSRWMVLLCYPDGSIMRWQGVNAVPANIDQLYNYLVDIGMPSLHLGFWGSYFRLAGNGSADEPLVWLESYLVDIYRTVTSQGIQSQELQLIAQELREDMQLATKWPLDANQLSSLLDTWDVPLSAEGLCSVDVTNASRMQMTSLFWALTQLPNMEECLRELVNSGALGMWRSRMRQIPIDERREERQQHEEERLRLVAKIESDIERRMATRRPFTAYEVAQATGSTARQASTVIRRFVRKGALEGVAATVPRQYVLTSTLNKRVDTSLPKAS